MDCLPDTTKPDHSKVQDDLAARDRPRHARALEALGEHRFTSRFRDTGADGKMLALRVPIAHPMRAFVQVGIGLLIILDLVLRTVLPP
jgi:hypothetical protein